MERQFGIPGSLVPLDMEARELVIGEPSIPLQIDVQTIPYINRLVLGNTIQQYDQGAPELWYDPFWASLDSNGDLNRGMTGLGADEIKIEKAQPVRTSTVYLVVGAAALAVAGAMAFWWMSKRK